VYALLDGLKLKDLTFEHFLDLMTLRLSEHDSREEIMKIFRLFDEDGNGTLSVSDLQRIAKDLGENMTREEIKEMVDRADLDGDGVVSFEEFFNVMTKKNFE